MKRIFDSSAFPAICSLLGVWFCLIHSAAGQLPSVDDQRLGVDALRLQGGKRLYGFVLSEDPNGLRVAVERAWLTKTHPEWSVELAAAEAAEFQKVAEELPNRVRDWIDVRSTGEQVNELLLRYLQSELNEILALPSTPPPPSPFAVLVVPREEVRKVALAKRELRTIAGLAFQNQLENVTTTPATLLSKQLESRGVDIRAEVVDLSDQLPVTVGLNDKQWSTKKALVEFQFRKPLEFQGTADTLIEKTDEPADLALLAGQLLSTATLDPVSQLGAELGLPEFLPHGGSSQQSAAGKRGRAGDSNPREQSKWWATATQRAAELGVQGVLVQRLEQSLLSDEVKVYAHFLVADDDGTWFEGFRHVALARPSEQTAERVEQLKQSPQIKQLLDTLSSLGLDASQRLEQAMRHGVATQQAMQSASGEFYQFLGKATQSLSNGLPADAME